MTRRIVLSVLLAGGVLACGAAGFGLLVKLRTQPQSIDPERPPLAVSVVELVPTTAQSFVEGYGTARADREAVLGAEVSGVVVALAEGLREGVGVTAGDVLIRLDDRDFRAQATRARSQLTAEEAALARLDVEEASLLRVLETARQEAEVAEREYARIRGLLEGGTSSPRELDAARVVLERARRSEQELDRQLAVLPQTRIQQQAACEQRRAELALAELNVARCTLTAPFAGRVRSLRVELGEHVAPGRQLLTLLDPERIEVPIELPVSTRDRVRAGAAAHLLLESNPGANWTGRVARLAPHADETTRTFAVFVEVDNTEQPQPLLPGMFVRATIDGPPLTDVLLIPRAALRRQRVFVCRDGAAWQHEVAVVENLRDRAVIRGLPAGTLVITSNLDALYDGAPVTPRAAAAAAAPLAEPP